MTSNHSFSDSTEFPVLSGGWLPNELCDSTRYAGALDFAFVIHPRSLEDLFRAYPRLRSIEPDAVMDHVRTWPVEALSFVEVPWGERTLRGEIISIPFLPFEFRQKVQPIQQAVRNILAYCRERQTVSVGLGALLPSATRNGADLSADVGTMNLTTGHAYTAHVMAEYVRTLEAGLADGIRVGLVGAGGSIGRATLTALCQDPGRTRHLILFDSTVRLPAIAAFAHSLGLTSENFTCTDVLADLRECPIVACATNAPAATLRPEHLARGAVIIDDTQPPNLSLAVAREAGVVVLKCLAQVPGLKCSFDYGLFPRDDLAKKQNLIFTCLAETILLSTRGPRNSVGVGTPATNLLETVAQLSSKLGITPAPFHSFPEIGEVSSPFGA